MKAIVLLKYFKTKKGTTYKMRCKVNEAIAELEAIENRSCENCKYSISNNKVDNVRYLCSHSQINFDDYCPFDFDCRKWELK